MAVLLRMREISDRLALKYDIPIIVNPEQAHSMSYAEWNLKKSGQSFKEQMRQDIQFCLSKSTNYLQFIGRMQAMGYGIRDTENSITYINPAKTGKCRGKNLGPEYSKESILAYFEAIAPDKKEHLQESYTVDVADIIEKEDRERKKALRVNRYDINGRRRSDLEILILKAIKLIQYIKDKFNKVEVDSSSPMHQSYQWKLERLYEACEIANTLGIQNFKDLDEHISEAGKRVSITKSEYTDMKDAEGHLKALESQLMRFKELQEDFSLIMTTKSSSHRPVDMESLKRQARLHPSTPEQRRELYLLMEDNPSYFIFCKYKDLPEQEITKAIQFLSGMDVERPSFVLTLEELEDESDGVKIDIENFLIAPTEEEKMVEQAKLFPCTATQRRELYQLLQEKPFYHSADKFRNLSYHQMEQAISFLSGKSIEKPDCLLDQAEFDEKAARIKYERIAAKMLQTIREKNVGKTVPKQVQDFIEKYNIDTDGMDYTDIIHVYTYYKPWNPEYKANTSDEKVPQSKVEEIEFLLKENHLELNLPVKDLTVKDANQLARDLMLKFLCPEAVIRQTNADFNEAISQYGYEDRKKITEYRAACQEMLALGYDMTNVDSLLKEIDAQLAVIREKRELHSIADDEYRTLMQIKEYCGLAQNKQFVYGNKYKKKEEEKDELEEVPVIEERDAERAPSEGPDREIKPRRRFSQEISV